MMFYLVRAKLIAPLDPKEYATEPRGLTKKKILSILRQRYEELSIREIGYIVAILDCKVTSAEFLPLDRALYVKVEADMIVFRPEEKEIVEGTISSVGQTSVYVDIGLLDALLPVTKIGNDVFKYDARTKSLKGLKTKMVIKKDDIVRAQIESAELVLAPVIPAERKFPQKVIEPKYVYRVRLNAKVKGLGVFFHKKQASE